MLKVGLGRTGRWKKGFSNWWSSTSWTCTGVLLKCRIRVSRSGVVLDILQVDQIPSWCMEFTGPALIAGKSVFLLQSGCWASSRRRVEADLPLIPPCATLKTPQQGMFWPLLFPPNPTRTCTHTCSSMPWPPPPHQYFLAKVILRERNLTPHFPGPCRLAVRIPEDWKVKTSPLLHSGDVMSRLSPFHGSR